MPNDPQIDANDPSLWWLRQSGSPLYLTVHPYAPADKQSNIPAATDPVTAASAPATQPDDAFYPDDWVPAWTLAREALYPDDWTQPWSPERDALYPDDWIPASGAASNNERRAPQVLAAAPSFNASRPPTSFSGNSLAASRNPAARPAGLAQLGEPASGILSERYRATPSSGLSPYIPPNSSWKPLPIGPSQSPDFSGLVQLVADPVGPKAKDEVGIPKFDVELGGMKYNPAWALSPFGHGTPLIHGFGTGLPSAAARGATFGKSRTNDYRATFFAAHPELEGQVAVHHAVEQQVLTRYPGVVGEPEIHSLENLRGIPNAINSDLHLSHIRREWNEFYRQNPNPTQQQLLDKATDIDSKYGSQFNPPR